MTYYFPYSTTYLRQHMQRISWVLIRYAIYATSALFVLAIVLAVWP